ncbi:hypothetical protein GCM10023094_00010 [Rhodococcus olei]|uniref:Uncharacterized protein n=1 Tax=Rhodococcus olei TaxID=2161675 RepID=A0ABP8NPT1_9NOCA
MPRWVRVGASGGDSLHDDGRRVFADTDEVTVDPRPARSVGAGLTGENCEGEAADPPLTPFGPLVSGIDG